jgi:hypothetical protein
VLVEVRPVARLRGPDPVRVQAALEPVLDAVGATEVDLSRLRVVCDWIRWALEFVPAERLVVNPDCGLRHLPAEVARAKLRAMVAGTAAIRSELGAEDGRVVT